MASSRLERIGTIYTRITGLMRAGALKFEDKPVWYEVYEAFPPKNEPTSTSPLPSILYPEDEVRAKFHKLQAANDTVNLMDKKFTTKTQKFVVLHKSLEREDNESTADTLFDAALQKFQSLHSSQESASMQRLDSNLASTFQQAQRNQSEPKDIKVNVQDIFKDN